MRTLLLARHGNTFAPGEPAVWVGAHEDLPLVASGRQQALQLGQALAASRLKPVAIMAGPLLRTTEYAHIVAETYGGPTPECDDRLCEIDYGDWGGQTSEALIARHGDNVVTAWNERGQWPERGNWRPDPGLLRAGLKHMVNGLERRFPGDETVLLVSSNGILRFFLDLVPGAFALMARDRSLKTATGAISALNRTQGPYRVAFWNQKPDTDRLNSLALSETDRH